MKKFLTLLAWAAQITAAIILLQTLYFKFTAHPQSVYIFTKVGMEPWGRIGSGIVELIASVLLFVPGFRWLGALMGMGTMAGAILFHLTILGIEVDGDSGLFALACVTFVCCALVLVVRRQEAFEFLAKYNIRLSGKQP